MIEGDGEKISDELLNAYVDGELSARDAAAIVERIAQDSALARRVSALSRLKSELSDLSPADARALSELRGLLGGKADRLEVSADAASARTGRSGPEARRPRGLRVPCRRPQVAAALAVAVAVIIVLGTILMPSGRSGTGIDPRLVEAAVRQHLDWMKAPAGPPADQAAPVFEPAGSPMILAEFARRNGPVYVPDLAATRLHVVRSAPFGPDGVQVRYVGVHDCRLSLFVWPAPGRPPLPMQELHFPGARVVAWRVNRLDYLLVAAGMDPQRFDLIAQAVFEATRRLEPFGARTRTALDLQHRKSRPCSVV